MELSGFHRPRVNDVGATQPMSSSLRAQDGTIRCLALSRELCLNYLDWVHDKVDEVVMNGIDYDEAGRGRVPVRRRRICRVHGMSRSLCLARR